MNQVLFKEKQRCKKNKIAFLGFLTFIASIFFLQLLLQTPHEKTGILLGAIISVGYLAGITFYLWRLQLKTEVNNKKIKFKYSPLHSKKHSIKPNEIAHYKVVETPFLAKLSGWNVQFNTKEHVYSLSGRTGLELTLKDGQHIFIGSQKPAILKEALDSLLQKQRS